MNLNTIQLDAQLLADLYPNNLIETVTTTVPETPTKSEERTVKNEEPIAVSKEQRTEVKNPPGFLGNNGKKILVLVSHRSVPFLPDEELNFLTSVLAACKLSMADIALANLRNIETSELPALIESEANSVLLFGIEPSGIGLPINFPQFQLQQFNKRSYLHAPSLGELEKNKEAKKQLWNSLKKLFGI